MDRPIHNLNLRVVRVVGTKDILPYFLIHLIVFFYISRFLLLLFLFLTKIVKFPKIPTAQQVQFLSAMFCRPIIEIASLSMSTAQYLKRA